MGNSIGSPYSGPVLRPRPLAPGDSVRVIAPSGPFDRTLFLRGVAWLAERYRVRYDRGAFTRTGYLAGNDARRLDELDQALRDPTARAIVGARGGYGATRICHAADFESLRRHPKWCVGFSDFTALHLEAIRVGVASLHAPNVTSLGRGDAVGRAAWIEALERPLARRAFRGLQALAPGRASGTLVGGNLSLLFASAAAHRLRLPDSCLLFFEEVNEAPYRIDRMLTSLLVGGHLLNVTGVCVGNLTDGTRPELERESLAVVLERLAPLRIPIVAGLPVGHTELNLPLPLGLPASLDADPAELIINP
jgi:muramoyltetrapeptide carboxypeptidase